MAPEKIFCVSGWATDSWCWEPVTALTDGSVSCHHVPWWKGLGTVDDSALAKALDGCERPVVVAGWSLGGLIALSVAATRPEKVAGLVLIGATARMSTCEGYPGSDPRFLREMRVLLKRDCNSALAAFAGRCLSPAEDAGFTERLVAGAGRIGRDALELGLHYLMETDLRDRLGAVKAPTVVIHGQSDQVVPVESGRFLAQELSSASLEVVPGKGHALLFINPELITMPLEKLTHAYDAT